MSWLKATHLYAPLFERPGRGATGRLAGADSREEGRVMMVAPNGSDEQATGRRAQATACGQAHPRCASVKKYQVKTVYCYDVVGDLVARAQTANSLRWWLDVRENPSK